MEFGNRILTILANNTIRACDKAETNLAGKLLAYGWIIKTHSHLGHFDGLDLEGNAFAR